MTQALAASDAELGRYLETTRDATASELDRNKALEKLAKTLPELQGLTMDDPGTQAKITAAYEDRRKIVELEVEEKRKQKALEESIVTAKEKQYFLSAAETTAINTMLRGTAKDVEQGLAMRKELMAENELKFKKETIRLEKLAVDSQRKTDSEKNIIQERINKKIEERIGLEAAAAEAEKMNLKAQRDAEAAKKKAAMQAEADALWLTDQRLTRELEATLRLIEDDEMRELKRLELRETAAALELSARGGDKDDLIALEEEYDVERRAITDAYQAERDDKAKTDKEDAARDKATLLQALNTEEQNEILRVQLQYDALYLLAVDDAIKMAQLKEDYAKQEAAIVAKYAKKETDITVKSQNEKRGAWMKFGSEVSGLLRELGDASERNQKRQRALAVADIIVNQAMAMAAAVTGATKASAKKGGNPVVMAAYIVSALAVVAGTFLSIKSVFAKSGESPGAIGAGGGGYVNPRSIEQQGQEGVPLLARMDSQPPIQAYVVQSQLAGQMAAEQRLAGQIYL